MLALPPEMIAEIVVALMAPGAVPPFSLDVMALAPSCTRERMLEVVLEAMHAHRASLGSVMATRGLACTCRLLRHHVRGTALARASTPPPAAFRLWTAGRGAPLPELLVTHLAELETHHTAFLSTQRWATGARAAAAADETHAQMLAFCRARAARSPVLRTSLWTMHLSAAQRRACCVRYAPPAWPRCRDVNLRMREILVDWLAEVRAPAGPFAAPATPATPAAPPWARAAPWPSTCPRGCRR